MQYITPSELAEIPGAKELAQIATAEHLPIVDVLLMQQTLTGSDRTGYQASDIAAADDALNRIVAAMDNAESIIDGFLVKRGYSTPLQDVPDLVMGWTRDIGRYLLHKNRISGDSTDPIVRNYKDAMKFLRMIVDGSFSLGATDPVETSPSSADVQFSSDEKVFAREQMNHFR